MRAIAAALLLVLTACAPVQQAVDTTARQGAKGVVTETLATRFPQVPKELITPFTDCIIDNSSALEIRDFAKAAVLGVDDQTVATVRAVLARPETVQCLQTTALRSGII
ncbi:hypothetical protein [Sulfitobacter geojensis]|uniref:Succinate dehydrogenase n=1 Tax=Sulfitobacter geojensis TaxID=1342299 RepID=A0AAE2VXA6_9RHOB|nr:hypothetical protein [Sulfitobacter geojensis]KHA51486.1 putative lipoprotein [Sulfitobacter geojensis]MBM1689108.1 hypothetical protein [Sulfitobacter geojensis]MBM1693175.1 hypothetical protein [Sulfitobacter geojensis]MBM1705341.1 hypothetical protein [Sulfitobacter geojensis]MBM1709399.1 hypothetical protein [Sulfitobacter geojensis]